MNAELRTQVLTRVDQVDFGNDSTFIATIFDYNTDTYEFVSFPEYKPPIFINDNNGKLKTLFGKKVRKIEIKSLQEYKDLVFNLEKSNGDDYYKQQALIKLSKYGVDDLNKIHYDKDPKSYFVFSRHINDYCIEEEYDFNKRDVLFVDIEVLSDSGMPNPELADKEILLITVKSNKSKYFVVFTYKDFNIDVVSKKLNIESDKVIKVLCKNEKDMLKKFINKISISNKGFIITGWNFIDFDWRYILKRIQNLFGYDYIKNLIPNKLETIKGKIKISTKRIRQCISKSNIDYVDIPIIPGLSPVDYRSIYIKFSSKEKSSYSLNHIAETELGYGKIDIGSQTMSMDDLSIVWDDYVAYNINDVMLVEKLDKKLKLLNLVCYISTTSRLNIEDVFGETLIWKHLIYKHCILTKKIIPDRIDKKEKVPYVGGNVEDIIRGVKRNIVVYDFKSLYPNLIRTFNISPEVKISRVEEVDLNKLISGEIKIEKDGILSCNGVYFRKDIVGIYPELMTIYFNKRQDFNKKKKENKGTDLENVYDIYQQAIKILINSLYGASGTNYFIYYDPDVASAITTCGRYIAKFVINRINNYLNSIFNTNKENYIIASDTDSIMIDLSKLWECELSDKDNCEKIYDFCSDKLYPIIDKAINEFINLLNANPGYLYMEQECIAISGVFFEKKKYVLYKGMEDGVKEFIGDKEKLKIRGISLAQSTLPEKFRPKIKKVLDDILHHKYLTYEDVMSYVLSCYKELNSYSIEDLAKKCSVSGIDKYLPEGFDVENYKNVHNSMGYKVISTNDIDFILPGKGASVPYHVRSSVFYNCALLLNPDLMKKYELIKNGDKVSIVHANQNDYGINYCVFKGDVYPVEIYGYKSFNSIKHLYNEFVLKVNEIIKVLGFEIDERDFTSRIMMNNKNYTLSVEEHKNCIAKMYPNSMRDLIDSESGKYYDWENPNSVDLTLNAIPISNEEQIEFIKSNIKFELDKYHKNLLLGVSGDAVSLWGHVAKSICVKFGGQHEKDEMALIPLIIYSLHMWDSVNVDEEIKQKEATNFTILYLRQKFSDLPEYVFEKLTDFIKVLQDDYFVYKFQYENLIKYLKLKYGVSNMNNIFYVQNLSFMRFSILGEIYNSVAKSAMVALNDKELSSLTQFIKRKIKCSLKSGENELKLPRSNDFYKFVNCIREYCNNNDVTLSDLLCSWTHLNSISDIKVRVRKKIDLIKSINVDDQEINNFIDTVKRINNKDSLLTLEKELNRILDSLY